MSRTDGYLTRGEAAELTGLSQATIKRRQKDGRYPNTRPRPDDAYGTWEIPVADLVAAGDYDGPVGPQVHRVLADRDVDNQLLQARRDLDLAEARAVALADQLRQSRDEIRFLRGLVTEATRVRQVA